MEISVAAYAIYGNAGNVTLRNLVLKNTPPT
jgi:hypothetical protein